MTPIFQAQCWKFIRTNKSHKRTRKNVLIPLISLHIIMKTQLHYTTPICEGTTQPNTTYIFSALGCSFGAVLSAPPIGSKILTLTNTQDLYHLNTILVWLYNAAALPVSRLRLAGSLAIIVIKVRLIGGELGR